MNKIILVIAGLLGMGAAIEKEHLDFRPEISTGITNVVLGGEDDIPVVPPVDNNDCPCNKNTGIITQGDGHQTKCPCDNGECGCVNKPSEPEPPQPDDDCPDGSCRTKSKSSSSRPGLLKRIFRR
jgi:hypothetical protein